MLISRRSKRFLRDIKKLQRRGKDGAKLHAVMADLIHQVPLAPEREDHKLQGEFRGRRECHIEFDWVLVYKIEGGAIIFERTGTHSDIFG